MAGGSSVIGALRVNLGLDSAQFTAGLKKAETGLGSFGKAAGVGLAAVAVAATAAATAFGIAAKGAIDHADALSKSAQKAGVTTEALSRLAYAASFSDVSMETLTGSLGKLSKAMADSLITPTSTAAIAFKALGISVTDSTGQLRDSTDVFSDIAEKFALLKDGSTKTALAMQIFGKSGAALIPMLNGGGSEIKRFADEADRLGITLSTKTGKAAEKFNDTLSYIGKVMQGVVNQVTEAALPALQSLADLLASPEFAKAAKIMAVNIVSGIESIVKAVTIAVTKINELKAALNPDKDTILRRIAAANGSPDPTVSSNIEDRTQGQTQQPGGAAGQLMLNGTFGALGDAKTFGSTKELFASLKPLELDNPFKPLGDSADDAKKKADLLKGALAAIGPAGKTAADMASERMRSLGDDVFGSLGNISGALGDLFKQNKAFAVSTAILQGLQGVAYALGSSAPPWNFINAAAVGIEAAANVANILSTNENSTSMPGGAGSSAASAVAAQAPQQGVTFNIHGSGTVGVDDIVNQIVTQARDGGYSDLVQVMRTA